GPVSGTAAGRFWYQPPASASIHRPFPRSTAARIQSTIFQLSVCDMKTPSFAAGGPLAHAPRRASRSAGTRLPAHDRAEPLDPRGHLGRRQLGERQSELVAALSVDVEGVAA